jgi:thiamine monophosphate synthase
VNLTFPILCLITDRRRLGARLGMSVDAPTTMQALLTQVAAAAAAGVSIVQVRDADLTSRGLVALVAAIRDSVSGHATRVLVNDRVDVALASQADGHNHL